MLRPIFTSSDSDDHSHRKELFAICASFFMLGGSFATWASRIPAIRDSAMLIPATLGYVLLVRGIGTVSVMPVVASGIHHFGARKVAFASGIVIAVALIPLTLVNNWIGLALVMLVTGAASSSFNVSINTLGSHVESRSGKSHMSMMHSWFGVGNLGGALLGSAAAGFGIPVLWHFCGMSVLLMIVLLTAIHFTPENPRDEKIKTARLSWPKGSLIWLGLIVFMASTIESSINNWVTLFFTDRIGVDEGIAPAGYAAFAGSLLLMRLIGDRLKMKFGAKKLIITGSVVATSGLILALSTHHIVPAAIGFFATGAGVAFTFPMVFSAAGKEGAIALASVATFGYLGGMISQPVLGFIVSEFELFGGFLFITVATASVSWLAWKARRLDK